MIPNCARPIPNDEGNIGSSLVGPQFLYCFNLFIAFDWRHTFTPALNKKPAPISPAVRPTTAKSADIIPYHPPPIKPTPMRKSWIECLPARCCTIRRFFSFCCLTYFASSPNEISGADLCTSSAVASRAQRKPMLFAA